MLLRGIAPIALLLVLFGSTIAGVSAAHESNNRIVFQAEADADASGSGTINYVKGREGESNLWVATFRFAGLTAGSTYTVRAFGPGGSSPIEICSFTVTDGGRGRCTAQFPDLPFLGGVTVTGDGAVALRALRAQGDIVSSGGCREPDQAGGTCAAPGR